MQRFFFTLIIFALLSISIVSPAAAWLFGDDTLVTIEGNSYSTDDYKRWWQFMKEDDSPVPETPDSYIDWLLLGMEAERMQLTSDPGFQRGTEIFLLARTLLILKNDEVDSQIDISEDVIKAQYEESFLPLWNVERLQFKNEQAALAAWQDLADGKLTIDKLREVGPSQYELVSVRQNWMRPVSIDKGWTAILEKVEVGEVVNPAEHKNGATLYFLKEKRMGSEEDLASVRGNMHNDLWRKQEDLLTHNLIKKLQKKYEVVINQERLDALDLNAADATFTDDAVVTTNKHNISEKEFIAIVRRLQGNRPQFAHIGSDPEKAREFKNETVFNIIAQSVTNWEALDRNYEEIEPFKWSYEFNYNHRLGLLLEDREFAVKTDVTDEEIVRYYDENIKYYSQPPYVKFYLIDETQGPISQIWAEASAGKDFLMTMKMIPELKVELQEVPLNHIDPEVRAVLESLTDGETSQIFSAQGVKLIVHRVGSVPGKALPLERVKESIRNKLKGEKITKARNAYLELLKAQSEINLSERNWQKIQKELGGK